MEKSDEYRRLRSQKCIILNENKFNGHKGLYIKSQNPNILINDAKKTEINKKLNNQNFDENKSKSIHHQLLKEMRFQSINFIILSIFLKFIYILLYILLIF